MGEWPSEEGDTHGICPDCMEKMRTGQSTPELDRIEREKAAKASQT